MSFLLYVDAAPVPAMPPGKYGPSTNQTGSCRALTNDVWQEHPFACLFLAHPGASVHPLVPSAAVSPESHDHGDEKRGRTRASGGILGVDGSEGNLGYVYAEDTRGGETRTTGSVYASVNTAQIQA